MEKVDAIIKIITDEYIKYGIFGEAFTAPMLLAECLDQLNVNYIVMSGFKNYTTPDGHTYSITHGYVIISGKGIVDIASIVTGKLFPEHDLCHYDLTLNPKFKIADIYNGFYSVDKIRNKQYDYQMVSPAIRDQVLKIRELCQQQLGS